MKPLVLHPTETSQWQALVNEAQASTQLVLNEDTESYLVFLLMRFSQTTRLIESVVALDFLHAMHSKGTRHIELLREVGDKSLLLSGLFPGIADKRHVKLDYFTGLGQAAYLTISERQGHDMASLYVQLSEQFITLQRILQAMRWVSTPLLNQNNHSNASHAQPMH